MLRCMRLRIPDQGNSSGDCFWMGWRGYAKREVFVNGALAALWVVLCAWCLMVRVNRCNYVVLSLVPHGWCSESGSLGRKRLAIGGRGPAVMIHSGAIAHLFWS